METRQSRMNKYYDNNVSTKREEGVSFSRTKRNQALYKEVSSLELEEFDLNSNSSVIVNNTKNISLDEIKDILDEKYKENPRNKSFGDTDEIALPSINLDETREYDINTILEKAKQTKEVNYEEDRLKKVRNTQYDILKNLDIMNNEEEIEEEDLVEEKPTDRRPTPNKEKEEQKLLDLIDTIAAKELIDNESNLEVTGEMDPLDILSDLRGDDENTKVMGALSNNSNEEDTLGIEPLLKNEEKISVKEIKAEEEEYVSKKEVRKMKLDDSFVGNTTTFKQEDFDDFDDLKDDGIGKIIVKILVVLIILGFIVGCVILANNFLDLGLF